MLQVIGSKTGRVFFGFGGFLLFFFYSLVKFNFLFGWFGFVFFFANVQVFWGKMFQLY